MSCEKNRLQLQAYLDRILARDDAAGVERHLARCEACRTEKERLVKVMNAVGDLTPLKAPAGFKEAFMERLTQGEASEGPQRGQPAFQRLRRMIPLSLAASFIIVGLTAYLVYFAQRDDGGRVPATGRPEDVAMKREGRGKKGVKTFDAEYPLENKQSTDGLYKGMRGNETPAAEMVADEKTGRPDKSHQPRLGQVTDGESRRAEGKDKESGSLADLDEGEGVKMIAEAARAMERLENEESTKGSGKGPGKGPGKGISDSTINTVVVMGSKFWSIPETLLARAESRGIVVPGKAPRAAGPAGPATPGGKVDPSIGAKKGRLARDKGDQQADKQEGGAVEAASSGEEASSTLRMYLEEGIEWEYAVFEGDTESLKTLVSVLESSGPDAPLGGNTDIRLDGMTDSNRGAETLGKEEPIGPGKLEKTVVLFGRLAGDRLEIKEQCDALDPSDFLSGTDRKRKSAEDGRDGISDDVVDLPEVRRWFAGARFKAYDESPARETEKMNRPLFETAKESKAGERRKIILVYPKKRITKEAEK